MLRTILATAILLSSLACAGIPAKDSGARFAARDAAIMDVLDRYMDGLNALDIEAHVSTYHFPHYRHASGKLTIWENAEEAMPILRVPEAE